MDNVLKITLDTNCIVNILDDESKTATSVKELGHIFQLCEDGIIDLAVTTRFQSDQSNDNDKDRAIRIANKLSELPVGTISSSFRLDVSVLNGSDMLGSVEIIAISNELTKILFPSGINRSSATASNKINDVDHLIGHFINNRDIFITDDKGILRKAETIRNLLGITTMNPSELVNFTKSRIKQSISAGISGHDNSFISMPSIGEITFDYSSNNGNFTIGQGIYAFDTKWSKASDTSIHAYNDGSNVEGIAIAKGASNIRDVLDATNYDFSSRCRTPNIGQVLLLKNSNGIYAAIQILDIQDDTRRSDSDSLTFKYAINQFGVANFSKT